MNVLEDQATGLVELATPRPTRSINGKLHVEDLDLYLLSANGVSYRLVEESGRPYRLPSGSAVAEGSLTAVHGFTHDGLSPLKALQFQVDPEIEVISLAIVAPPATVGIVEDTDSDGVDDAFENLSTGTLAHGYW